MPPDTPHALKILKGPEQAPLDPLAGGTVAVLGFGNQGAAHAMNLRDSGIDVRVGNRVDSESGRHAIACGFEPRPIEAVVPGADLVIVALPDEVHGVVWREKIAPHLQAGAVAGFLHGFSVRYGRVEPTPGVGVVMVAPKGPGHTLRQRFEAGLGIPCLFAVEADTSEPGVAEQRGLAWANGIGCARAAIVYTTFADEAETDLFGEQSVLCGGMTELILGAFETLVDAGYPPELAYLECCHEVKQVADLVYERGLAATMAAISNTAEFGAYKSGPVLVDDTVRARMRAVLDDVRSGRFAEALRDDHDHGFPWFTAHREALRMHAIEAAGAAVREWMPKAPETASASAPEAPAPQAPCAR